MKSPLKALGFGLLLCLPLLYALDRLGAWSLGADTDFLTTGLFTPSARPHPTLGFGNGGRPKIAHKFVHDGQVIFDVTYHFNRQGHRRVPQNKDGATHHALFFGGSQTFGHGLSDDQTIAKKFADLHPPSKAYLLAYGGYGPQQMYLQLDQMNLHKQVTEKAGVAFYIYYSYHKNRVHGALTTVRWASGYHPRLTLDRDGQLQHHGSFLSSRPLTTLAYWLLAHSAVLKHLDVQLPADLIHRYDPLTCEIIRQSQKRYQQHFPGARFVVVLDPNLNPKDQMAPHCFAQRDFHVIDLSRHDDPALLDLFPIDRHNTARAAAAYAQHILAESRRRGWF